MSGNDFRDLVDHLADTAREIVRAVRNQLRWRLSPTAAQ